ncbi:MAG: iron-containing alcohol dehydrogenase, partial [Lachnospiraceae bacterium]
MKDFVISIPQNIVVGLGSMKELPKISKKVGGTHAFIISGPNLTKMGLVATCSRLLEQSGLQVDSFTETEANPSTQTVEKATKAYLDSGADFIVALGGGSPMDLAKAVGVIATYGGDIVEYEGGGKVPGEIVPLIAIPTTAGTGSEVTAFSVITDISRNYKLTIVSNHLLPS